MRLYSAHYKFPVHWREHCFSLLLQVRMPFCSRSRSCEHFHVLTNSMFTRFVNVNKAPVTRAITWMMNVHAVNIHHCIFVNINALRFDKYDSERRKSVNVNKEKI